MIERKESKLEQVAEAVKIALGEEYNSKTVQMVKNNRVVVYGILVLYKEECVGTVVYLEERNLECSSISELADFVCRQYQKSLVSKNTLDSIKEYGNKQFVLSNVVYQLINREKNADFLKSTPHKDFLDLALIYRVVLAASEDGLVSYVVENSFLSETGISLEELDEAARENTIRRLGVCYHTLDEVLKEHLTPDFVLNEFAKSMYVLTNKSCTNGAALLVYPNVLADLAEKLGSDLIVLPSSIHEVLIIVDQHGAMVEDLHDMVEAVNEDVVREEEFLSNNVYRFAKDTGVLEIVV